MIEQCKVKINNDSPKSPVNKYHSSRSCNCGSKCCKRRENIIYVGPKFFTLTHLNQTLETADPDTWKESVQKQYDKFSSEILEETITCPVCQECEFARNGTYTRRLFLLDLFKLDPEKPFMKITITRIICKSCRKTFSIHPYWMIPYSPFVFNFSKTCMVKGLVQTFRSFKKKIDETFIDKFMNRVQEWFNANKINIKKLIDMPLADIEYFIFSGNFPPYLWDRLDVSINHQGTFNQLFTYIIIT